MDDLSKAILSAWSRLGPSILADHDELAARLARRRLDLYTRPLRHWCLAVRANDRRINCASAIIVPEHVGYPADLIAPAIRKELVARQWIEHEVTIDAPLLEKLCVAVQLNAKDGHRRGELAELLGTSGDGIKAIVNARGLEKAPSIFKYRPRYFGEKWMDPCSANAKRRPHAILGDDWMTLGERVPEDFQQTLVRTPRFRSFRGQRQFNGWRWICPGCKKHVRSLFYPLKPANVLESVDIGVSTGEWDDVVPTPTVACKHCHKVLFFSYFRPCIWNILVHHLSGGLLRGREVEPPPRFTPQRRKPFRPLGKRPLGPSHQRVLALLLQDLTFRQIAREAALGYDTLRQYAHHIYRRHNVHNRAQLRELLNPGSAKLPARKRVAELLLTELTGKQIAAALKLHIVTVRKYACAEYKRHGVHTRQKLIELLNTDSHKKHK